jgi:hypothetical protein
MSKTIPTPRIAHNVALASAGKGKSPGQLKASDHVSRPSLWVYSNSTFSFHGQMARNEPNKKPVSNAMSTL